MTGPIGREYLAGHASVPQNHVSKRHWLVTVEGSSDELPVRTFPAEADAVAFIAASPPYPSYDEDNNSPDVLNAYRLGDKDVGEVWGLTLYEFADDRPVSRKTFFWSDALDGQGQVQPHPVGWSPAESYAITDGALEELFIASAPDLGGEG